MKNKLIDLNNHLFAQLERLSDEELTPEDIEKEVKRTDAIVAIADQIIQTGNTALKAAQLIATHGDRFRSDLPMLAGKVE